MSFLVVAMLPVSCINESQAFLEQFPSSISSAFPLVKKGKSPPQNSPERMCRLSLNLLSH
jgi:hypothetical protein